MMILSRLVRENNIKVVITGEGADEMLAGYNIFREAKIRRFWASQPGSSIRPLLLTKLYPDIPVEILYNEPYFKVRVGLFRNKSEGFKLFKEIEKDFPGSYFIIENEMEYPPL